MRKSFFRKRINQKKLFFSQIFLLKKERILATKEGFSRKNHNINKFQLISRGKYHFCE